METLPWITHIQKFTWLYSGKVYFETFKKIFFREWSSDEGIILSKQCLKNKINFWFHKIIHMAQNFLYLLGLNHGHCYHGIFAFVGAIFL